MSLSLTTMGAYNRKTFVNCVHSCIVVIVMAVLQRDENFRCKILNVRACKLEDFPVCKKGVKIQLGSQLRAASQGAVLPSRLLDVRCVFV